MRLWRKGFALNIPSEYIEFHKDLAERALATLVAKNGLTVHNKYMAGDGWADSMKVVYAVVEEKSGRLVKLSWHDGNEEFFEHGSGSWPYRLSEKKSSVLS